MRQPLLQPRMLARLHAFDLCAQIPGRSPIYWKDVYSMVALRRQPSVGRLGEFNGTGTVGPDGGGGGRHGWSIACVFVFGLWGRRS